MPWYGFIHPVLALITLALGLVTAQTSISKLNDWDFPMRRQRSRTIAFLFLCLGNFAVGLTVNSIQRPLGKAAKLTSHLPLAVAVMVVALLAVLVTFARGQRGEVSNMMRWHAILMVAALGLIFTMGFLGIWDLFSH